jgi:hypothetical protein
VGKRIEALTEAFSLCENAADFLTAVYGEDKEVIADAIECAPNHLYRKQLGWFDIYQDYQELAAVTHWQQVTMPQERFDAVLEILGTEERDRLSNLYQQSQEQPLERQWGISRSQAEEWGASFEWIRGEVVRIAYAAADYLKLSNGQYARYSDLRLST